MDKDEFERIKQGEKSHLRKLKELKQTLSGLRRTQSSRQALDDMTSGSREVLDTHAEFVDRLSRDAAMTEARMEIALEAERERSAALPKPSPEEVEEELRKARAQALVQQMRGEISGEQRVTPTSTPDDKSREPGEKTIGRAAPAPEPGAGSGPAGAEKPAKTIGRMRP